MYIYVCVPRARERRQKLTPRDKEQRKLHAEGLLRCLWDGLGPKIFLDEAKMELNPYLNSTKDRYCGDIWKHHLHHSCCCCYSSESSRQWQAMLEMPASMAFDVVMASWCLASSFQMAGHGVTSFSNVTLWIHTNSLLPCGHFLLGWELLALRKTGIDRLI